MKILQIHSEYSTSKISGENTTVLAITQMLMKFSEVELYNPSTLDIRSSFWLRLNSLKKYLFLDHKMVQRATQFDIVIVHNPIPIISSVTLRRIAETTKVIRVWHNYRNSCISGNHFRNRMSCHKCSTSFFGKVPGIRYRCYRKSFFQSFLVSFVEFRLTKVHKIKNLWHVAVSDYVKNFLESLGIPENRIKTIRNSVDFSSAVAIANGDLLMMGRIEPEKGFLPVLEAWNQISLTLKRGRFLHLVGEGNDLPIIQELIRPTDTIIHGYLDKSEILQLAAKCSFGIAASLWDEPFGKIAIEYQALGLRVIATPRGGLKEIVEASSNGILAGGCTLEEIKKAIEIALEDHHFEASKVVNRATLDFSRQAIGSQWKSFIQEVLND